MGRLAGFSTQPFLTIQATCLKALCVRFSSKLACPQPNS